MKKILLLISVLAISAFGQTKRVLFIGNSYTGTNDLPSVFNQITTSGGETTIVDSNTPGGQTFQGHTSNSTTISKIQQGNWDFVVLQEQSQIPSFPEGYVTQNCYPYATQLNNLILQHNPCAETVFYMTWGRQNGDASNCATHPPVCTYEGMDDLLKQRYLQMGQDNQAIVASVGAVWRYIRTNYPEINLYSGDGSHPSFIGTYAAGLTFYSTLFRKNPETVTYTGGITADEFTKIKNAVTQIVFNNLQNSYVGNYDTTASFTSNLIGNLEYQFTNTSTNAATYLWDFGDGSTSTDANPTHLYTTTNIYNVSLTATKCGKNHQATNTINLLSVSDFNAKTFSIYPNPTTDIVNITSENENYTIKVYNYLSQILYQEENCKTINFSNYNSGTYFIELSNGTTKETIKIIKQ